MGPSRERSLARTSLWRLSCRRPGGKYPWKALCNTAAWATVGARFSGRMFSGIWNAPHARRLPSPAAAGSYRCPGRDVVSPFSGAYEDRMSSDERHRDVPARERPRNRGVRRLGRVKNTGLTVANRAKAMERLRFCRRQRSEGGMPLSAWAPTPGCGPGGLLR